MALQTRECVASAGVFLTTLRAIPFAAAVFGAAPFAAAAPMPVTAWSSGSGGYGEGVAPGACTLPSLSLPGDDAAATGCGSANYQNGFLEGSRTVSWAGTGRSR
jgi:hypothetical protein